MTVKKKRLTAEDWLLAGFRALTELGPQALKAEALARGLGATKGSFYWHFKDVSDFHERMLAHWETHAFDQIVQAAEDEDDATRRLFRLGALATQNDASYGGSGTEPAIRAWGRSDRIVAAAVARVDGKRLDYIRAILTDIGVNDENTARVIYGAYIGMGTLSEADRQDNSSAMSALLTALLNPGQS